MAGPKDGGDDKLSVHPPHRHAAGIEAVAEAMKESLLQMGPVRTAQTLLRVNQPTGFDCPGCAWPEGKHTHTAEFCENGAKAVAEEATTRKVRPDFFARHSIAELANRSDYWLGQQGRLTHPMIRRDGADHYTPIGWDEAFDLIAERIGALDDPQRAVFYTSGRTSNEAAFLYQLLARLIGTNNLPDCSNMCHESSGSALVPTVGIGKGTVSLEDVETSKLLLICGQNPGTNHPRMLSALEKAKANGATIVVLNPLPEAGLLAFKNPQTVKGMVTGAPLADLHCQIRLGGDHAFFVGLNKLLLERSTQRPSILDRDFIDSSTTGWQDWVAAVQATDWPLIEAATGLPRSQLEQVADLVESAESMITCWAMGLTQHRDAVPTLREVVNLHLATGQLGRPGAGLCPVRGHSNVQGDRTMGIYEKPWPWFLDALDAEFSMTSPREHGHDVVEAIRAMRDGQVEVFLTMGGNFVRATPDSRLTEAAVATVPFTVHVSTKLNNSHAHVGQTALILPTLGRTDRDRQASGDQRVTVEDSMGMVHASLGRLTPPGDLVSEIGIVCQLGTRLFPDQPWQSWQDDYSRVRDLIERIVPGFDDYNTRIAHPGGFALPNSVRDSRSFNTPDGLAHFTANPVTLIDCPPGRLILQTLRSHDQYNTTIYGMDDRYRGIKNGRRVVFVAPADLAELGHADGDLVDMVSEWSTPAGLEERRVEAFRVVEYPTARGCAAAYFPEANALVPLDHTAQTSNTPVSKAIIVRLEASSRTSQPVR